MKNFSWILPILSLIALAVVIFPGYQYWKHFGSPVPLQSDKWGHLGDFLNVWVSLASLIMLGGLTYYIHRIDQKRDDENKNVEGARSRPYLVMRDADLGLMVRNVGNGPALNVRYAIFKNGNWRITSRLPSLMSGEEIEFDSSTATPGDIFGFSFSDIHGTNYSSLHESNVIDFYIDNDIFMENNAYKKKKEEILKKTIIEPISRKWSEDAKRWAALNQKS